MLRWSPAFAHALTAGALVVGFEAGLAHATPPLWIWALALPAVVAWAYILPIRAAHYARLGLPRASLARLAADVATVFGAGLTPRGSGTVGALAALPAGLLLARIEWPLRAALLAVLLILSVVATRVYLLHDRENLDPGEVVVDEWIGVLLTLAFVPWCLGWVVAGFVAFRVFDIAKPGPIAWVEHRLPGAYGVMFDDVLAGLTAGLILALVRHFAPGLPTC